MNERKLDGFGKVIEQYQEGLFRFAFFRTGSMEDSQDIVQNVFLRLYDRGGSFAAVENVKSYLYRSVSNACSDYYRKKQSIKTVPLEHAATKTGEDHNDDAIMEFRRIDALMAGLPYGQAEVIRMRTVDSLAFAEIAEILSLPVATVKSRFRYGIDKLRTEINLK